MKEELSKSYNPKETEGRIYEMWEKAKAFEPKIDPKVKPYVISIPPPNVTGSLHMGHALNDTIQDILIRRSRMKGVPTLWIPGTDHAGIATQNVVEKSLLKKDISRQSLGRDKFIEKVWEWVDQYGNTIIGQIKRLGCSCDWSRQRFTMDEGYSEAVKKAFIQYYEKGWIYQGERVVNWCTRCQTSLSDLEVEHLDQQAKLYYFKYDKDFPINIATTRPETKLGDTGVAVNPKDKRYTDFIDKTYKVNFCGVEREIRVFGDISVDMTFGTGAVGVTPAHSMVDYEMAENHGLDIIKVIDQYGRMTPEAGKDFEGLKVAEAQAKVIECLEKNELMEKIEEINNSISVCYRCNRPIEPQPSKQWFVKMKELAKPAIEAVEKGEIKFTPERWTKVYLDWMYNLRDWCISRQIWWGHRLPVWQPAISDRQSAIGNLEKAESGQPKADSEIYVGDNPPEGWVQSEDVLDTWFSSALWPFATLGWPSSAKAADGKPTDLEYFYPTSVLSTARDILYLWVARMIFSGLEFMKEKPFSEVYIHPTIFNKEGKRMSKSLGTGIDPLELIDKYGADATRFGLTYINTGIQDLKFDEEAIRAGGKFANKLWNIARFVIMSLEDSQENSALSSNHSGPDGNTGSGILEKTRSRNKFGMTASKALPQTESDKVILEKLEEVIKSTDENLDQFRFGQVGHELYDFVWHDLADIYIEQVKSEKLKVENENSEQVLLYVLTTSLKLLHPIMPFVTEEIWQNLKTEKLVEEEMLITAKWPENS